MKFDLDDLVQQKPVWDFTVKIAGLIYDTVEPSRDDIAAMPGMKPDLDKIRELAKRYIPTGPPDEAWTDERLAGFMHGYLSYLASFLKKRQQMIDANFKLQFDRQPV